MQVSVPVWCSFSSHRSQGLSEIIWWGKSLESPSLKLAKVSATEKAAFLSYSRMDGQESCSQLSKWGCPGVYGALEQQQGFWGHCCLRGYATLASQVSVFSTLGLNPIQISSADGAALQPSVGETNILFPWGGFCKCVLWRRPPPLPVKKALHNLWKVDRIGQPVLFYL